MAIIIDIKNKDDHILPIYEKYSSFFQLFFLIFPEFLRKKNQTENLENNENQTPA